jgi:hypothetical protein
MDNDLGRYIPSSIRRWSESAIFCLKRCCRCTGCPVRIDTQKCQMKAAVLELFKKFGKPKEEEIRSFTANGKRYYPDTQGKDSN